MVGIVVTATMCRKAETFPEEQYDSRLSGGAATVFLSNSQAFGSAIPGLTGYDVFMHDLGDAIFGQTFVSAPAPKFGGLGPVYNNVSCISCHHNDGKGTATIGAITSSLLTRISLPGTDENGGPLSIPGYGLQLQDKAISGKSPEAKVQIDYTEIPYTFSDGSTVSLRKPTYTLNTAYSTLPSNYYISVRLAPPVFGMGLLALIPDATILMNADEQDLNHDGISGKANYVFDPYTKKTVLGKFGLKANNPSLLVQVAGAFQQDMGITSYVFPHESSYGQSQDDGLSDDPELADSLLNAATFYVQTLAVPARRDVTNTNVVQGEKLFNQLNCSGCHTPTMYTGVDIRTPTLSNQRIHAYTDLLLHDLGTDLADGRPDFLANGNEWRTPALWGIGLFEKTNGTPFYLHDGRARTLLEAVMWHGGEAQNAKDAFVKLSKNDRDAVIAFLKSL